MGRKQYKVLLTICVLIVVAGYYVLFIKDYPRKPSTKVLTFEAAVGRKDELKHTTSTLDAISYSGDAHRLTLSTSVVPDHYGIDRTSTSTKSNVISQHSSSNGHERSRINKWSEAAHHNQDRKPPSAMINNSVRAKPERKQESRLDVSVNVTSERAVLQIPNGTLSLIELIENQHEGLHGESRVVDLETPKCERGGTPINGVEDLLCMTPPSFLPSYKNPCWQTAAQKTLKCLPYFQVIGMDKCGSTDLFDRIAKHPDVLSNNGALGKETMWWSWLRYGHWLLEDLKTAQSFERYTKYFSGAAKRISSNPSAGLITGDGTPMDMWDFSGWVNIPQNAPANQPTFLTPHLIKHMNPHVKLLIILRDPVERLFSDYFFLNLGKMTAEGFHNNLLKSIGLLADCTETMSLKLCLFNRGIHMHMPVRIHLGFYSVFLKEWLKVFPREQFFILRTEDFSTNMRQSMEDIYQFLNLRKPSDLQMKTIVEAKKKHVTQRKQKAKMLPESRVIAQRLYEMFNKELATILNDEKFTWPEMKRATKP